jgi:hypothetical protein
MARAERQRGIGEARLSAQLHSAAFQPISPA